MGLFSSVKKIVGKVAGAVSGSGLGDFLGPAGYVIDAASGFLGQSSANSANRAMAEKQMKFQSAMSNTSYQRAMEDMEAAGLNPMLAYSQGGASTPSGASGAPQQSNSAASMASRTASAAITNMQETNKNISANTAKTQIDTLASNENVGLTAAQRIKTLADREKSLADMALSTQSAKNLALQNKVLEANIPGAQNEAAYQKDIGKAAPWAKNSVNLLKDLLGTANSAKSLTR